MQTEIVEPVSETLTEAMQLLDVILAVRPELARRRRGKLAPEAVRLEAYGAFQRAIWDMTITQQLVRSMVPKLKGGFWTFPAHSRRLQAVDDGARAILLSFADVQMVGGLGPRQSSYDVTLALGNLGKVRTPIRDGDIPAITGEIQPLLEQVGEKLRVFREEARKELRYDKLDSPWWRRRPN